MIICHYTELNHQWSEQELADKLTSLPEKLQHQALRKRLWIDRQLSIAGKLLLLRALQELDSPLTLSSLKYNTYQRPYFDEGIDFNIAHSGNIVICCGVNNGQIGIDIEQVKEIDLTDYPDYFTPNEWDKINSAPIPYEGFYDIWTRKEAVLKAIGTGFHTPLSSVDVSGDSLIYDEVTYYIKPLDIYSDYKCHMATTQIQDDIRLLPVDL
jgi:4'-phosphopantetheinyl transferase